MTTPARSSYRPRRLRFLPTAGAMLALLPLLMLSACGRSSSSGSGQVAATVNKGEVSVHQVNLVLQQQSRLKPEQLDEASRVILDRLIDQELLVQQAESLKLDRDPRVMQLVDAARREVLARAVAERTAQAVAQPAADEVRSYYDSKPQLFKERRIYTLQEIQVRATPAQLDGLRERVQTTKNLVDLGKYIKEQNLPAQANQTTAAVESLPAPLVERLAPLKDGQGVYLVEPAGARIVIRLGARDAPLTLEQARPTIEAALRNERQRRAVDDEVRALRQAATVKKLGKFAQAPASAAGSDSTADAAAPPASAAPADLATASGAASGSDLSSQAIDKGLAGLK